MSQYPHYFTTCPSDNSLAYHIKQCPDSHNRLQQVLQALTPNTPDPFDPFYFDKDTTDFIPVSTPNHVSFFPVEERAQLDLLRILGKAGVSLQTQDKIIDWACHYSHVNKLHNSEDGEDFWICLIFPGREPFLNN